MTLSETGSESLTELCYYRLYICSTDSIPQQSNVDGHARHQSTFVVVSISLVLAYTDTLELDAINQAFRPMNRNMETTPVTDLDNSSRLARISRPTPSPTSH